MPRPTAAPPVPEGEDDFVRRELDRLFPLNGMPRIEDCRARQAPMNSRIHELVEVRRGLFEQQRVLRRQLEYIFTRNARPRQAEAGPSGNSNNVSGGAETSAKREKGGVVVVKDSSKQRRGANGSGVSLSNDTNDNKVLKNYLPFNYDKFVKEREQEYEEKEKRARDSKKRAEVLHNQIVKFSSGLLARSEEQNYKMRRRIESQIETGSLTPAEERKLVSQLKQLKEEMSYSDVVADAEYHDIINRYDNLSFLVALREAYEKDPTKIPSVVASAKDVSAYVILDNLKSLEAEALADVSVIETEEASKKSPQTSKKETESANKKIKIDASLSGELKSVAHEVAVIENMKLPPAEKAVKLGTYIQKKVNEYDNVCKKLNEVRDEISKLSQQSEEVFSKYKIDYEKWRKENEDYYRKREEKRRELEQEVRKRKREQYIKNKLNEREARKKLWIEYIDWRLDHVNTISSLVASVSSQEDLDVLKEESQRPYYNLFGEEGYRIHFPSLDMFINNVSNIYQLRDELDHVRKTQDVRLTRIGSKMADEAFSSLHKKADTSKNQNVDGSKMLPTKKELETSMRRSTNPANDGYSKSRKGKNNRQGNGKKVSVNLDDFIGSSPVSPSSPVRSPGSYYKKYDKQSQNKNSATSGDNKDEAQAKPTTTTAETQEGKQETQEMEKKQSPITLVFTESQQEKFAQYEIEVPQTLDDISAANSILETRIQENKAKVLKYYNKIVEMFNKWKETVKNDTLDMNDLLKGDRRKHDDVDAEGKQNKKNPFDLRVPLGLFSDVFNFTEDGWVAKFNLHKKPETTSASKK